MEDPFVAQLYEKTAPSPPIFRRFVGDRELLVQGPHDFFNDAAIILAQLSRC
jgi:hypothetical protein